MQSFVYNKSHYTIQHIIPGIFTLLIGIGCIVRMMFAGFAGILAFVLILCIYNVWNEFVSLSNPCKITIDENTLTFQDMRQTHIYKINEISAFSMRMVAGNTSIYMNVNKGGILKGRYWVRVEEFTQGEELIEFFYELDEKVNPDSLFTQARKGGRERLAKKKISKHS